MDDGATATIAAAERRIIERPRLTKILDESKARTILLIAPAGYGKTTLARQWLRDKPHIWYQATAASADPAALAAGIDRLIPSSPRPRVTVREAISSNPGLATDPDELATLVAENLTDTLNISVLAIDDYHLLDDSGEAVAFLLCLLRLVDARAVITTRHRPRWLFARQLVYGDVTVVTPSQLAMTADEVIAVLGTTTTAAKLAPAGNAWPVLVGLAAAAAAPPGAEPIETQPTLVYQFLTEELLRETPPEIEELLLDGALRPSVLNREARREIVEDALRRSLLQTDARGTSIHPVLLEFLQRRLAARDDGPTRIERAIRDAIADGDWDECFALIQTFGRTDWLGPLLHAATPELLHEGRSATVDAWVRVARKGGYSSAVFDYVAADRLSREGKHDQAATLAAQAASRVRDQAIRVKSLLVAGRSASLAGRGREASEFYDRALEQAALASDAREALLGRLTTAIEFGIGEPSLPKRLLETTRNDPEAAIRVATARIFKYCRTGPVSTAIEVAEEAQANLRQVRSSWTRSAFLSNHSFALILAGDYESARSVADAGLEAAQKIRFKFGILQLRSHLAIADIGLRRYAPAARQVQVVASEARRLKDPYFLAMSRILRTRLLLEQGLASDAIRECSPAVDIPATRAARGELYAIRALAHACSGTLEQAIRLARSAIAETDAVDVRVLADAAETLARLDDGGIEAVKSLMEVVEQTGAADPCIAALRASPRLRKAFKSLPADRAGPIVIGVINAGLATVSVDEEQHPLSRREKEVYALVQQGLKNHQIARSLFISEATVKVHVRHIYEKLGVQNRAQAIAVAHEIDEET